MTLPEVLAELERERVKADREDCLAKKEPVLQWVIDLLQRVDDTGTPQRVKCEAAGFMLGVTPTTVQRWAKSGRFPGAVKSSGDTGEWLIPVADLKAWQPNKPNRKRLWRSA